MFSISNGWIPLLYSLHVVIVSIMGIHDPINYSGVSGIDLFAKLHFFDFCRFMYNQIT